MSDRLIFGVVFAAGLPLVIWWSQQQRIRYPWRGRPSENPRRGWMSRHGLTADEADDVARAVIFGAELPDGRLRAAAADWAEVLLRPGWPHDPRTRRILHGLLLGWLVIVAGLVVRSVVIGPAYDVPWGTLLVLVALPASLVHRRRKVRRALTVNSDHSSRPDDTA